MKNFVSVMGSWAHEQLALALANYEDAHNRLTTLDGFMELASTALADAKEGKTDLLDTLDLMSDILTDYVYRGDNCFGRTEDAFDLTLDIDTFCFESGLYDTNA